MAGKVDVRRDGQGGRGERERRRERGGGGDGRGAPKAARGRETGETDKSAKPTAREDRDGCVTGTH